jgi:antitoxin (DNA-binding transcriptional repressor) of toxin-antitoxin stability system
MVCSHGLDKALGTGRAGQRRERIGITRRGKLAAVIVPARKEINVKEIFADIEEIRKSINRSKRSSVKELIEEGRV